MMGFLFGLGRGIDCSNTKYWKIGFWVSDKGKLERDPFTRGKLT